jgi:phosphoglycolate phosphatase/pyrophosphatase PpaX
MLKYPCLVLDHDDTVVQTERYIGFPYFRDYIEQIRPGQTLSFQEYVRDCNNMVFADMCRVRWNMTEEELDREYQGWIAYYKTHPHPIFPGISQVIRRQKEAGGLVCVASLSREEDIRRDYREHFGIEPDAIYDYDLPSNMRKPNPYPLQDIMGRFALKPEQILVVDDMRLGWMMASPLHVPVAYAAWSKEDFPDLTTEMRKICDFSFDKPADLEKFLFE